MVVCFRAVRHPLLSLLMSRRMGRRLAGVPSLMRRRDNSRSDRCVQRTPARIGSPAVHACNRWRRVASGLAARRRAAGAPLFCGCAPRPHPRPPPARGDLAGEFWDRRPKPGPYPRSHHAPVARLRWPHTAVGPSPRANRRSAASSLRSLLETTAQIMRESLSRTTRSHCICGGC